MRALFGLTLLLSLSASAASQPAAPDCNQLSRAMWATARILGDLPDNPQALADAAMAIKAYDESGCSRKAATQVRERTWTLIVVPPKAPPVLAKTQ